MKWPSPARPMAYTGAPVDGAPVRYRVVREVQYPRWWYYWYRRPRSGGAQEIAHGTVRTDEAGKFRSTSGPSPTPRSRRPQPVFTFSRHGRRHRHGRRDAERRGARPGGLRLARGGDRAAEWQETGKPVVLSGHDDDAQRQERRGPGDRRGRRPQGAGQARAGRPDRRSGRPGPPGRRKEGAAFRSTPDWRKWPDGPAAAKRIRDERAPRTKRLLAVFRL